MSQFTVLPFSCGLKGMLLIVINLVAVNKKNLIACMGEVLGTPNKRSWGGGGDSSKSAIRFFPFWASI